jgi:hypothetical protein
MRARCAAVASDTQKAKAGRLKFQDQPEQRQHKSMSQKRIRDARDRLGENICKLHI